MISATRLLLPQHLVDLRRSGLTDQTIEASRIYSERDPKKISRILRWSRPATMLGDCLVFPYPQVTGELNGFARVKPDKPRATGIKYEQPLGISPHAYFCPGVIVAAHEKRTLLAITEGEKKSLAIDQSGLPCIGLSGVWAWQAARKPEDADRRLIQDLVPIDWCERIVLVIFDRDPRRNPNVNHAQSELVRVLSDLGAIVHIITLPIGPRGEDDAPGKMAADDFIVAHGAAAFRHLLDEQITPQPIIPLEMLRQILVTERLLSVEAPGVYVDRSPTGAGKSFADIPAAKEAATSLTVLPTHKNCDECEQIYIQHGLLAVAYPELNKKTCLNYEEAIQAIDAGLAASSAVCPTCPLSGGCLYRPMMEEAEKARHRIATHKRAELSLPRLVEGAKYITVHEDAAGVLVPLVEFSTGLATVARVALEARELARQENRTSLEYFLWRLEDVACWLSDNLNNAATTAPIRQNHGPFGTPPGADAHLFGTMKSIGVFTNGDVMRVCKALAAGDLAEVVVRVDKALDAQGQTAIHRSIVAVWRHGLPNNATTWLNDATADPEEIALLVGQSVVHKTPRGTVERKHPVVQVPVDVKQSTATGAMLKIVRGVMAAFPDKRKIGVICHRCHAAAIRGTAKKGENMDPATRARIARVEHFRGGLSRASNVWTGECDLLLVVGTPRVPPAAVKDRLIRTSRVAAITRFEKWQAAHPPAAGQPGKRQRGWWDFDYWSGVTTTGKRRTIRTLAYTDHDWYQANRSLVAAELIQAVGRGRSILASGIPVVVITTEDIGLPIHEIDVEPMDENGLKVLQVIAKLSDTVSKGE